MTDGVEGLEPKIKEYPGFGEITLGTSSYDRILFTAMCMSDNPQINQYFLDLQLNLMDNTTKTKIFPREGMSLPGDATYTENTNES